MVCVLDVSLVLCMGEHSNRCVVVSHCCLICNSLMTYYVDHLYLNTFDFKILYLLKLCFACNINKFECFRRVILFCKFLDHWE